MRKLTLNRDALLELSSDELAVIVAGATEGCLSKLVGCNTADSWCEITYGC